MEGLSQDVLSFLIDIQEHGANNLRALSADFKVLGSTADQIGVRLKELEAQLARTGAAASASGEKIAAAQGPAVAATERTTAATGQLAAAQKGAAAQAAATAGATDKLTAAERAQATQAAAAAAAEAKQAAALRGQVGALGAADSALSRHASHQAAVTKRLETFKTRTGEAAHALNPLSLGLLVTGGYAIKMGLGFEAAMTRLHTQAGYAEGDVKSLEATVVKAGPALHRTPTELAEALYHVASVGVPARDAMKVIEAGALGANIGASKLDVTTNGLVIVMKSLKQHAGSAREDMGLLNEIVGAGNLHMEDLVASLGKVLPAANTFGLGLRDVGAALAVMTGRGLDANVSATRLAMTFNMLGSPRPNAIKAFQQVGLNAHELAEDLQKPNGLLVAIRSLHDHLENAFPKKGAADLSLDEKRHALAIYKKQLEETGVSGKELAKAEERYATKLAHSGTAQVEQGRILSEAFGGGRQSGAIMMLVQGLDDLDKTYKRLPGGAAALKKLSDAEEAWAKTSQAQMDHVKASFSSAMTSLGKTLAPVVLPALTDIAEGVKSVVEAFDHLPHGAKVAIEALAGLVAVAGPIAGLMSRFAGAALLIERLKASKTGPLNIGTGLLGSPAGGAGAASSLIGISGFSGSPVKAGSRMNPLAVAVIGQVPGGGSGFTPLGKAASEEEKVAQRTVGKGVGLGTAEELGLGVAGAPAAAKLSEKLLGGGKALLGRAGAAGMIYLGGSAVSSIAGDIIGGKTGKDVSGIGNDAAIGAAIGTMIEPGIGTAIGAGFGSVIGAIKLLGGPSHADAVAGDTTKGVKGLDSQSAAAATAAVAKNQQDIDSKVKAIEAAARRRPGQTQFGPVQLNAPETHQRALLQQRGYYVQGEQAGAAQAKAVLEGVKFPDLGHLIGHARAKMAELAPIARRSYADMIRAGVEQLEKEKRLPQGSLEKVNAGLKGSFGSLVNAAGSAGALSMKAFSDAMKNREALGNAKLLVERLRKEWEGIPEAAKTTQLTAATMFEQTGAQLAKIVASSSGDQKKAAEKAYAEWKASTRAFYLTQISESKANLSTLAHQPGPLTAPAVAALNRNYEAMRNAIKTQMRLGVISQEAGLDKLAQLAEERGGRGPGIIAAAYRKLPGALQHALEATKIAEEGGFDAIVAKTKAQLKTIEGQIGPGTNLGATTAAPNQVPYAPGHSPEQQFGPTPHGAKGMRVPGHGLLDTVPIVGRRGGVRGIVAPGELLIANRHTERDVNKLLAPHGVTLGQMVVNERRPHSAPLGHARARPKRFRMGGRVTGFEAAPGTNFTVGKEPQIAHDLNALGINMGATIIGISGYRTPAHSVAVGGFADDPHTRGEAADTGPAAVVARFTAALLARFGLERPFYPAQAKEINHVQLLGSFGHPAASGPLSGGGAGGSSGPARYRRVSTPRWSGPGGLLGAIGRAALRKATAAANARLARAARAGGGGAGVGKLVPGIMGIEEEAARIAGIGFDANVVGELLTKESGGGINEPPSGPLKATGPNQVIPSTFAAYAIPGHKNIKVPLDNAIASMRYIHSRYKTLANMAASTGLFGSTYKGYAKGGRVPEHAGAPRARPRAPEHSIHESRDPVIPGLPARARAAVKRARFAGHFAQGGVVTAKAPTLAVFGEKGPETAIFVPHAATSAEILGRDPSSGSSEKETEGLNPDNNEIETHTASEWRRIRLHHSQRSKRHHHHGAKGTREVPINIGPQGKTFITGLSVDLPSDYKGAIDVPGDVKKLSSSVWKKVMRSIESVVKQTSAGGEIPTSYAAALAHQSQIHPSDRMAELAKKALVDAEKTVVAIFKKAPDRIHAGGLALGQLTTLFERAVNSNNRTIAEAMRKSAAGVISSMSASITSRFSKATNVAKAHADYRAATSALASITSKGAGAAVRAGAERDPQFLAEQQAAIAKSIAEYQREEAAIRKLVGREKADLKKLHAKQRAYMKSHHGHVSKILKGEIAAIEAAIGEAGEQLDEVAASIEAAKTSEAEAAAEHLRAVYEQFKEQIDSMRESFEGAIAHAQNLEKIEEGTRELEGKSFGELERKKGEQGGSLTPQQVQQAQEDLASYTKGHQEQIEIDEREKAYDESVLGGLSGPDRTAMERRIEELGVHIIGLKDEIYEQTNATKKLTEATKENTKAFGGSVGFEFNGQTYTVGGQSSISAPDIGVGL